MGMQEMVAKVRTLRAVRQKWWLAGSVLLAVIALGGVLAWHPWQRDNNLVLPRTVLAQAQNFTPYQPLLLPAELRVEKSSVTFNKGILVFRLTDPSGRGLTVTEQASPPQLSQRTYNFEKVDGVDGTAYITRIKTRTFATFFATGANKKPTMILINTTDPFSDDTLKDLLRSFRVASPEQQ
jgi:hypothetical protein